MAGEPTVKASDVDYDVERPLEERNAWQKACEDYVANGSNSVVAAADTRWKRAVLCSGYTTMMAADWDALLLAFPAT